MINKFNEIRKTLKEKNPLIHSITNPISINQCANAVLAVGGRPIMAEHPLEVAEITETSKALMLNLGNVTDVRMKSMLISAGICHKNNIPFVYDAVGVACSELRRNYTNQLISKYSPAVIKGNYAEIKALYNDSYRAEGVDTDKSLKVDDIEKICVLLSKKYGSIILASGKEDIVTDGKTVVYIKNGTEMLGNITGTGCMLGAICASYVSVCPKIEAVALSCVVLGICGEMAQTSEGNGTFFLNLMDKLSTIRDEDIIEKTKMEVKNYGT